MEGIAQALLTIFLVSAVIMSGMTGYRLKNYHDGLLSASLFVMLLRSAIFHLEISVPQWIDRTWLPLLVSALIFMAVFLRHIESELLCRCIDRKKGEHG